MSKVNEHLGDLNIEDSRIPYTAVAVDLVTEREIWFTSGPMIDAMRGVHRDPVSLHPADEGRHGARRRRTAQSRSRGAAANVRADAIIAVNLSGTPLLRPADHTERRRRDLRLPKLKLPSLPDVIEPAIRALLPGLRQRSMRERNRRWRSRPA